MEVERQNRKKMAETKKVRYIQAFSKKGCFLNKTTQTSKKTSKTYNSDFNVDTPLWSEASSSEEEDIVKRKGKKKVMLRIQTKK